MERQDKRRKKRTNRTPDEKLEDVAEFVDGDMTEEDRKKTDELLIKIAEENELHGKIGKLKAEIARLREALERIVSECPACFEDADCPHNGGAGYDQGCLRCPWVIADVALEKEQK